MYRKLLQNEQGLIFIIFISEYHLCRLLFCIEWHFVNRILFDVNQALTEFKIQGNFLNLLCYKNMKKRTTDAAVCDIFVSAQFL